jgi:hypothetical protein
MQSAGHNELSYYENENNNILTPAVLYAAECLYNAC